MNNGPNILIRMNQFLDTNLHLQEALLQPHQASAFNVVVDDYARCHVGKDEESEGQYLQVDSNILPLHFDGWKYYFRCRFSTSLEFQTLQVYDITSP